MSSGRAPALGLASNGHTGQRAGYIASAEEISIRVFTECRAYVRHAGEYLGAYEGLAVGQKQPAPAFVTE